jgi:hypothetical protein
VEKKVAKSSVEQAQKLPYARPELRKQGRIEDMTMDCPQGISKPINF